MYGVASGDLKFCCIECARHAGHEPDRMLFHFEYDDTPECHGCGSPITD